jgi:hypothetical protein
MILLRYCSPFSFFSRNRAVAYAALRTGFVNEAGAQFTKGQRRPISYHGEGGR